LRSLLKPPIKTLKKAGRKESLGMKGGFEQNRETESKRKSRGGGNTSEAWIVLGEMRERECGGFDRKKRIKGGRRGRNKGGDRKRMTHNILKKMQGLEDYREPKW